MAKGDGGGGGGFGNMMSRMKQPQGMSQMGQGMGQIGSMMGMQGQKPMPAMGGGFDAGPTPERMPNPEGATGGPTREDLQRKYMETGGREGDMGGFNPSYGMMKPQVQGPNGESPNQMGNNFMDRFRQSQGNQFGQPPQMPQMQGNMFGPNQPPAWGRGGNPSSGMMRGLFGGVGGGRRMFGL